LRVRDKTFPLGNNADVHHGNGHHADRFMRQITVALVGFCIVIIPACSTTQRHLRLESVRASADGKGFVCQPSGTAFVPWGFNYDHDEAGRLIEDYWETEWPKVEEDFQEMKELGANVVRVHLQFGRFMASEQQPNAKALARFEKLVRLAERTGLSDQVGVELEMLSEPASLLPLVAEELRDGEPADRLLEPVGPGRHHPRERGRHFGPQRHVPLTLVGEGIELAHDLVAALGGVQLQRLQRRPVVFLEPVPGRDGPPGAEDVRPERQVGRIEIAKARQGLGLHGAIIVGRGS